jgi:hypothetical protein
MLKSVASALAGDPRKMNPLRYGTVVAICLASCGAQGPANKESAPPATAATDSAPAGAETQPFWVYRNGHFNWKGDYSFLAEIDYHDSKGASAGHHNDIAVKIVGKWGGFQPFAAGAHFDVSHYKYLVYSLKPTVAGQVFATGFAADNDVADGKPVTVSGPPYGPVPVAGQWGTYKIPLSDFALTNHFILKFTIADGTGLDANVFYVDDIGFTTE